MMLRCCHDDVSLAYHSPSWRALFIRFVQARRRIYVFDSSSPRTCLFPSTTTTTTTISMTSESSGGSLAKVLKSQGPVVSCVLLRHAQAASEEDSKTPATNALDHLIEEIQVDTTPNQNGVQTILGGPFTFVGQFPSEGVVVMARSGQMEEDLDEAELNKCHLGELQLIAEQLIGDDSSKQCKNKADLITTILQSQLPVNPHALQPPLHRCTVRGDMILMRVGGENDEEEEEDENEAEEVNVAMAVAKAMADLKQASAVSNDDFFLSYTKEEYLAFAARTDIVAEEPEESMEEEDDEEEVGDDEEDDEEEEEEESDDEDFDLMEEEDGALTFNEEKKALMQLFMKEVLEQFRQLNKRGPSSEELLELQQQVAAKLGITLPVPPSPGSPIKKRAAPLDSNGDVKRVKFDEESIQNEEEKGDDEGDDVDVNPKAKVDETMKENDGKPARKTNASSTESDAAETVAEKPAVKKAVIEKPTVKA